MKSIEAPVLGYALMGLIHQGPRSGYDLRKEFITSPIGSFSDSPGSIYPALARLEKQKWVKAAVAPGDNPRQKRNYVLTAAGLAELKRWLQMPVTREDVSKALELLWLRCAFVQEVLGDAATLRFLREAEGEITTYAKELRAFRKQFFVTKNFSSGQLAFDCGLAGMEVSVKLIRRAIARLEGK